MYLFTNYRTGKNEIHISLILFQVGFFGNVAFCDIEISGDIVNHFAQNSVSDGIKMGFVMSIAVSIPIIVFPCRVSLYNLLFPQVSLIHRGYYVS